MDGRVDGWVDRQTDVLIFLSLFCTTGRGHVVVGQLLPLRLCEGNHRVSTQTVCTNHQLPFGE